MLLGNITMLVGARDRTLPPGVRLECHGPFAVPSSARALVRLLPEVDMSIVHHVIMYGDADSPLRPYAAQSPTCNGHILYAWARTGQLESGAVGLDFRDTGMVGDAYPVGAGSSTDQVSLQIHYQQTQERTVVDNSGVRLWFSPEPPRRPLQVTLLMSTRVAIPPRIEMDECVVCRVRHGGHVVGYRNHAHRLAREIFSEVTDARGAALPLLGRMSAQRPQVIRLLEKARTLSAGDTLQLHCQYDAREATRVTGLGLDERTEEMCNQYLVSTEELRVSCASEGLSPSRITFKSTFAEAARPLRLGQVTGVAAGADRTLYLIHRGSNTFFSTEPMAEPAIIRLSEEGRLLGTLPNTAPFVVPHGLAIDHHNSLWATDVATHRVYRLDASTGAVQLSLGRGSAGTGASAFNKPTDVAVSERTDEVYVADGYGNSRIAVFSYTGRFLREWGSRGRGPGQFQVPHSIAIDASDIVYVADRENARLQVFTAAGVHRATWPSKAGARPGASGHSTKHVWSGHVSSVSYNKQLDLLAVVEGGDVVLRTTSGCVLSQSAVRMQWPHDAVVLPPAGAARPCSVLAGASELVVYVAEMEAHRLVSFASTSEVAEEAGLVY